MPHFHSFGQGYHCDNPKFISHFSSETQGLDAMEPSTLALSISLPEEHHKPQRFRKIKDWLRSLSLSNAKRLRRTATKGTSL
mmetsp:Transcript_28948/g.53757  ORF Transcript_28948/g.53757 Transcript_28948/m.53757 type:complete len:82 (-) Transcript_28948:704-949(-)